MKTKSTFMKLALGLGALICLAGCMSGEQIKKEIEKDPSIVFKAIEKDPAGFWKVLSSSREAAQKAMEEESQKEESKRMDEEFKNPLKPVVDESRVFFGAKSAPITIVEFSDFQCPVCARAANLVHQLLKEYDGKVRILYKHLPLQMHPQADMAARFYEAVIRVKADKAQEFHNYLFENQDEMPKGEEFFVKAAKAVGLDGNKVKALAKSDEVAKAVETDMKEAEGFNLTGTPGFIINGVSLKGLYPYQQFKAVIDRHLAEKK